MFQVCNNSVLFRFLQHEMIKLDICGLNARFPLSRVTLQDNIKISQNYLKNELLIKSDFLCYFIASVFNLTIKFDGNAFKFRND